MGLGLSKYSALAGNRGMPDAKLKTIALYLLLSLSFVHEVNYGSIHLMLPGYLLAVAVSFAFFLLFNKINPIAFFCFCFIFFVSLCYGYSHPRFSDSIAYLAYLIPPLFLTSHYDLDQIASAFSRICEYYIILSMLFFIIGIGVDISYSSPRMQSLLSEPSAMALPISSLCIHYFLEKRWIRLLVLVLPAAYLCQSPTVYVSIMLCFCLFAFFKASFLLKVTLSGASLFGLLNIVGIFQNLYTVTGKYIFKRMADGFQSVVSLGASGYNTRISGLMEFGKDVTTSPSVFLFGRGLDSASAYYEAKASLRLAYNFPSEILFSFGIIGFVILFLLLWNILHVRKNSKNASSFLFAIVSYTLINSAMGIQFQYLAFLILVFAVRRIYEGFSRPSTSFA